MTEVAGKKISLDEFEEKVEGIIQAYLHSKKRMPTYLELIGETKLNVDYASTNNWGYQYIIFNTLEKF